MRAECIAVGAVEATGTSGSHHSEVREVGTHTEPVYIRLTTYCTCLLLPHRHGPICSFSLLPPRLSVCGVTMHHRAGQRARCFRSIWLRLTAVPFRRALEEPPCIQVPFSGTANGMAHVRPIWPLRASTVLYHRGRLPTLYGWMTWRLPHRPYIRYLLHVYTVPYLMYLMYLDDGRFGSAWPDHFPLGSMSSSLRISPFGRHRVGENARRRSKSPVPTKLHLHCP